jgi:hypothetical protein
MTTISLDQAVKNILLKRRYSIHWYLDFLVPAKDFLRNLSMDLPINPVQYKVLELNTNHAITIPDDYVDWVGVYARRGQYLVPLTEDDSLSLVPNFDSEFVIQPFSQGIATDTSAEATAYTGALGSYGLMVNWNEFGENLGRQFGGVGSYSDTFRENKRRNEIKINDNLCISHFVLEYIGNGLDVDSASKINAYCQDAIEAYCMWQFKENNRTYSAGEAQVAKRDYEQQVQILRARLSDITVDKLKRIAQGNSISVKY